MHGLSYDPDLGTFIPFELSPAELREIAALNVHDDFIQRCIDDAEFWEGDPYYTDD